MVLLVLVLLLSMLFFCGSDVGGDDVIGVVVCVTFAGGVVCVAVAVS